MDTCNHLEQEINEIKKEFGFNEHYGLQKSLQELSNRYSNYQESTEILQNIRPARTRQKLERLKTYLTKCEELLSPSNEQSLYQSVIDTHNFLDASKFINHSLPEFIKINEQKLDEAKINSDIGGIKRGSKLKFLITNLLMIYANSTNKDIKISWDRYNYTGKGEAFSYLIKMREVLPQLNSTLNLSKSDKKICNEAKKLLDKFNGFSSFRTKK